MGTMMRTVAAPVGLMLLMACGSSDGRATSIEAEASTNEGDRTSVAQNCPDPGLVPPDDQDPDPPVEVAVLSGDFGDEPWCLSVSESEDLGACISIQGGAAPEGQQLSSGACDGRLSRLNWYMTRHPDRGFVVYGHARSDATRLRFFATGLNAVDVETHRVPEIGDATFFASRLPEGFSPEQGAAYAGDQEIERKQPLRTDFGD